MIETEVIVGGGLRITVAKDELVGALGVVARAVSTRTSVQILSGILLEGQGGELRVEGTDMELSLRATVSAQIESNATIVMAATGPYRLDVKETELDGSGPELEAIVPSRALQELARVASSGDTVEVGVHENQVLFSTVSSEGGGAWLTTRRIDGQFPNYR